MSALELGLMTITGGNTGWRPGHTVRSHLSVTTKKGLSASEEQGSEVKALCWKPNRSSQGHVRQVVGPLLGFPSKTLVANTISQPDSVETCP